MYQRLCKPSKKLSFFLFGPRGVGKSWLLREIFKDEKEIVTINLLKEAQYLELLTDPSLIRRYLQDPENKNSQSTHQWIIPQWIIVDEVQRVPALLNEIHDIIEDPKYHKKVFFALTGSSARKLKRGGANLLASRALVNNLYPLSIFETENDWPLEKSLNWGSLPAIVTASDDELRAEILRSYVTTYIKEEIKEEQIVRKLEPFMRFLEAAAQANGELIQYSKISYAAKVDAKAVSRYFEILEDTLIGFFLTHYTRSARERTLELSKFYFFDIGVKQAIEKNIGVFAKPGNSLWGKAFEHMIINECQMLNLYFKRDAKLSYLKTKDGAEIDLIIELPREKPLCVEIKSAKDIPTTAITKLQRITAAVPNGVPVIVYTGDKEQRYENVRILPWREFLKETWNVEE